MLHENMHTHHTHCLHTYMCFTLAQFSVTLPAVNTASQMHLLLSTCLKLNKITNISCSHFQVFMKVSMNCSCLAHTFT